MSYRGNKYQAIPVSNGGVNPSAMMGGGGFDRGVMHNGGGVDVEPKLIEKLHKFTEDVDNFIGSNIFQPIKPYMPGIGRFLIVATFLEDAFRIMTQWKDQVNYIWTVQHVPYYLSIIFLALNVVFMVTGSVLVIFKRKLEYGVGLLIFVVVSQALVYGLIFNLQFFSRNLSLIGGLILALSDAFVRDRRSLSLPGLPLIEDKDKSKYLQLTGRILLIFLFLAYMFTKRWSSFFTIIVNMLSLLCCALVAIGFKARLSASILVIMLTIQNYVTNPYWRYPASNPNRDYLRYEHFQTLSIVGGLILLVNTGAGKISIDEKKKIY